MESPGTAKNVITVGAIEQLRTSPTSIGNARLANSTNNCATNQPWLSMTDSSNQVAAFSSRGNVGVGVEGEFGRFKPDVVAPGTFVVSTRSAAVGHQRLLQSDQPHYTSSIPDVVIATNELCYDSIFVPDNAVQVNLTLVPNTNSPVPFPDLPIFVKQSDFPTNAASMTSSAPTRSPGRRIS